MANCCEVKSCEIDALRERQGGVLKIVLAINAVMFVVEAVSGWLARSTSLLGDSLDMFGDSTVYAFSLFALSRGDLWRARAVLLKGWIMLLFGLLVLGEAVIKSFAHEVPSAQTMGIVGAMALGANLICLFLLTRHKSDDMNMRSTWLCSRNDIIANVAVLGAAGMVGWTTTGWPDLVVGVTIAGLFLHSSVEVLRGGIGELKKAR